MMRTLLAARQADPHPVTLKGGCEQLVSDHVLSFLDELREIAETATSLREQDELVKWIDQFRIAGWPLQASTLLDFCRPTGSAQTETNSGVSDSRTIVESLPIASARMLRKAFGVCYFNATMLEFFSNDRERSSWREATTETSGNRSLELLAQSRRSLDDLNTNALWAPLCEFRAAWQMEVLAAPQNDY
jgi:hypothetical protein